MKPLHFIVLFITTGVFGQSVPISYSHLNQTLRRDQVLGEFDSATSFTRQPISIDYAFIRSRYGYHTDLVKWNQLEIRLLPVTIRSTLATHHPYYRNDGALLPAKGPQLFTSTGIHAKYLFAEMQFMPEYRYVQNDDFPGFPDDNHPRRWQFRYIWWNRIDAPERFGNQPISTLNPGQSYLKLNYKNFQFGISTENLWWGPGKYNALLMSSNAQGFAHVTLNTRRPIALPIGSLEFQLIAGKINRSGFVPPDTARMHANSDMYVAKPKEDRLVSGLTVTYQPKWLPGLNIGFSKVVQQYMSVARERKDVIPVFRNWALKGTDALDALQPVDIVSSIFLRWLLPQSNLEFYFEFGRNSDAYTWQELMTEPDINNGFLFGFSKLMPIKKGALEFNLEVVMLQNDERYSTQNVASWYIDEEVKHGYTHNGEILGTPVGPGGNLQMMEIAWVNHLNRIGINFERLSHNNDFYYHTTIQNGNFGDWYVDYEIGTFGGWQIGNLVLDWQLKNIWSLNYQWKNDRPNGKMFDKGDDVTNLYLNLGLTWLFGSG